MLMPAGMRVAGREVFTHFVVGGLLEFLIPQADGVKRIGLKRTDHFVDQLRQVFACIRCADGNGDDEMGGALIAHGHDGGAHSKPGSESIVGEQNRPALHIGGRAIIPVKMLPPVKLVKFAVGDFGDLHLGDPELGDERLVQNFVTSRSDGADGELRLIRRAELADDENIERRVQRLRDLEADRHTAAREGEDQRIAVANRFGNSLGQNLSGFVAVVIRSLISHGRDPGGRERASHMRGRGGRIHGTT